MIRNQRGCCWCPGVKGFGRDLTALTETSHRQLGVHLRKIVARSQFKQTVAEAARRRKRWYPDFPHKHVARSRRTDTKSPRSLARALPV